MAGLSLGAWQQKKMENHSLFKIQFLMMLTAIVVSAIVVLLHKISSGFLLFPVILAITFIPAYLTGHQIALALARLPKGSGNSTSYLYGVDLLGSALGLMIISAICLPVFGYVNAVLILILVNIISVLILFGFKK
jgi:hypothetical protein